MITAAPGQTAPSVPAAAGPLAEHDVLTIVHAALLSGENQLTVRGQVTCRAKLVPTATVATLIGGHRSTTSNVWVVIATGDIVNGRAPVGTLTPLPSATASGPATEPSVVYFISDSRPQVIYSIASYAGPLPAPLNTF